MHNTTNKFEAKNFLLVFNSKAGKGRPDSKKETIIKYLERNNVNYKIIDTETIQQEVSEFCKYDAVVAVGGDGTVLKVVSLLVNTNTKLGIIPCGTANLLAASLCIPFNIQKAIDILIHGTTRKVDIGKAGNEYFALRIGMGYDAEVVNGTTRALKNKLGYLAYFIQGILSSFKLSSKSYKITLDDKEIEVNANSIIVANVGNMFRNLITVTPLGSINDGKLDIFILHAKNIWEFLIIFFQIVIGQQNSNSNITYKQAKKIKIHSNYKNVHIDGEPFFKSDLEISVIPNALMVVAP